MALPASLIFEDEEVSLPDSLLFEDVSQAAGDETLERLERGIIPQLLFQLKGRPEQPNILNRIEQVSKGAEQFVADIPSKIISNVSLLAFNAGFIDEPQVQEIAKDISQRRENISRVLGPERDFTDTALRAIGSGAASLAASIGGAVLGGPLIPAIGFGALQTGDAFQEAIEAGVSPETATPIVVTMGAVEGGLEAIGINRFLGVSGTFLKRTGSRILIEVLQEGSQTSASGVLKKLSFDPERPAQQILEETALAMGTAAIVSGGGSIAVDISSSTGFTDLVQRMGIDPKSDIGQRIIGRAESGIRTESEKLTQDTVRGIREEVAPLPESVELEDPTEAPVRPVEALEGETVPEVAPTEEVAPSVAEGVTEEITPEEISPEASKAIAKSRSEQLKLVKKRDAAIQKTAKDIAAKFESQIAREGKPGLTRQEAQERALSEIRQEQTSVREKFDAEIDEITRTISNLSKPVAPITPEIEIQAEQPFQRLLVPFARGIATQQELLPPIGQLTPIKPDLGVDVSTGTEETVRKITSIINSAKDVLPQRQKDLKTGLSQAIARGQRELAEGRGRQAFQNFQKAMKGWSKDAVQLFESPEASLSPDEVTALFETIRVSKLSEFDKFNTYKVLEKVLAGRIPSRAEIGLLERMFGQELAQALLKKRPIGERAWELAADIMNIPRTTLASMDLSWTLRQGSVAGVSNPKIWKDSFRDQLKAFRSKESAVAIDTVIRESKWFPLAAQSNLWLPDPVGVAERATERPEEFASRIARAIPLVERSERAFITAGNKFRMEMWSKYMEIWEGDESKTDADFRNLAKVINAATGRGGLGTGQLNDIAPFLNAVFFAPRWTVSRVQLLAQVGTAKGARKIAAGLIVKFIAANLILLAALKAMFGDKISVETDPRSSDFGKIRFGNVRLDFWAGYQQISRVVAQVVTGTKKTGTGKVRPVTRAEAGLRFLRGKLSPAASLVWDMTEGQSFVGEEMEATPSGIAKEVFNRSVPMSIQDVVDATRHQGLTAGILTLPMATLGVGVSAYPPRPSTQRVLLQDELARKYFGENWDTLGPLRQRAISVAHPELEQFRREAKLGRTDFSFVAEAVEAQARVGIQIQENLSTPVREEMFKHALTIGGLSRRSIGGWSMGDSAYKKYQDNTQKILDRALPAIIARPSYQAMSDGDQRELLEGVIKRVKELARKDVITDAMKTDIESIQDKGFAPLQ